MILDTSLPQAFTLSEQEELAGDLLSAEARASLSTQAVMLGEQICATKFNGTADEVNSTLRHFAYLQGQREFILTMIARSDASYAHLESLGNKR